MIKQSKASIFLSDQRAVQETTGLQNRQVLNAAVYPNADGHSFNGLYIFNDTLLHGGSSSTMKIVKNTCTLLLPVAGAVNYADDSGNNNCIAAGQAQLITAASELNPTISNPFHEHLVNYFQVCIQVTAKIEATHIQRLHYDDVNKHLNTLVNTLPVNEMPEQCPFSIAVGKFAGRGETIYKSRFEKSCVFVFVIEGAFEVEGRLLHARDGLAIWNGAETAIEALSNDALILLLALPEANAI